MNLSQHFSKNFGVVEAVVGYYISVESLSTFKHNSQHSSRVSTPDQQQSVLLHGQAAAIAITQADPPAALPALGSRHMVNH